MKRHSINIVAASSLLVLSVGQLKAQDVAPEIEALVGELAAEGYTEFTLEDSIFTPPTLVAEQDGVLLELELDPDTLEITETIIAVDEDGDGEVSAQERRRGITADELPAQASDRARAAVAQARERQRENRLRSEEEAGEARQRADEASRREEQLAREAARRERQLERDARNGGGNGGGGNGGGNRR